MVKIDTEKHWGFNGFYLLGPCAVVLAMGLFLLHYYEFYPNRAVGAGFLLIGLIMVVACLLYVNLSGEFVPREIIAIVLSLGLAVIGMFPTSFHFFSSLRSAGDEVSGWAVIVSKDIRYHRLPTYHVALRSSSGKGERVQEVKVTPSFYRSTKIGDSFATHGQSASGESIYYQGVERLWFEPTYLNLLLAVLIYILLRGLTRKQGRREKA